MSREKQGERRRRRGDSAIRERVHRIDPEDVKVAGPAVCPHCGAVYVDGRWLWAAEKSGDAPRETCPACRRSRDNKPAGILTLSGDYFGLHRQEILSLAAHTTERQNAEHPLKRIMRIDDQEPGQAAILFTDAHSPQGVGKAIRHAHKGDLDIEYDQDGVVRAYWVR